MKAYKLFLKLLFIVNLFVFCDIFAKESFKIRYSSNSKGLGVVKLYLFSDYNLFSIYVGADDIRIRLELISDRAIKLKSIDLMGSVFHVGYKSTMDELVTMYNQDGRWITWGGIVVHLASHKSEWREFIRQANGEDLQFCVVCIEVERMIEREYYFKVSAESLSNVLYISELL
ncbi:hypothetical protein [Borrelia hermsii]|nr:hypothetical protein [Borrelia hermsii]UCP01985.1 hypothetical protein K9R62_04940 [Borrelia hermsii]UPA08553.1 hypothetical protein bhDAH_001264 [Borrelia hermsii DAH]